MRLCISVCTFALAVSAPAAHAIQFCPLPDGTMGKACTLSDGTVYGCVVDLKECGALISVKPPKGGSMKDKATAPPVAPSKPRG